ncbi:hypothetical protein J5N97_012068 [Dioscorea zingiberensis]|uniref:Receptor-like serine/threonine-protein kinase n=1 Tax=Dioscorea zingiberensis TaxID=325984 RepID=A0A9D5HHF6_9LILI|nr:hypothetical protein J5N97_012068 [Dioscorea zingiberensis]
MPLLFFLVIILQALLLPCETAAASISDDCQISPNSILSPSSSSSSWFSPSGRFAFGFHPEGDGFTVGILFNFMAPNNTTTLIWNYNRDDAPVSNSATLKLTADGLMLLSASEGEQRYLFSDSSSSTHCASMLDSGNFVIFNSNNSVLWQTFDHPTDTIMGGQTLQTDKKIVSSVSDTNHSSGKFHLRMQGDNNLVMYLRGDVDRSEDAYWASNTASNLVTFSMSLDKDAGVLYLSNGTQSRQNLTKGDDGLVINNTAVIIFSVRIEPHGQMQVHSHDLLANTSKVLQRFPDDQCTVKGVCGYNSYCILSEHQTTTQCLCLTGFEYTNPNSQYDGCKTSFIWSYCRGNEPAGDKDSNYTMQHVVFNDDPIAPLKTFNSKEGCFNSCLEDCDCEVAQYSRSGACWKHSLPLRFGRQDSNDTNLVFIKVGREILNTTRSVEKKFLYVGVLVPVVSVLISIILVLIFIFFKYRALRYRFIRPREELMEIAPRFFSFHELCEATKDFKEELGKGAFGTVFKGTLFGKTVAVKRLEKVAEEGEREFRTEMKVIGRAHHRNLLRLLGFCNEGSNRLLVYEFMSNGSLADLIFSTADQNKPDWKERLRIALDVARGIHYLHEDCETHIIHCDIKPQNILMDDNWTARISDFGLAKLLMPTQTRTFTGVRGTRGYLAPEWHKNVPITVKTDVYSFGIVLLEILCCRKNMELEVDADEIILSDWVYSCYLAGELEKLTLDEDVDMMEFERVVKVGLWCIQTDPTLRPSMKNVIIMLEGYAEISSPPSTQLLF